MSDKLLNIIANKFDSCVEINSEEQVLIINDVASWLDIAGFIYKEKKLKFDYLMCITSYDISDLNKLGLAYNFHSTSLKHSIEIRLEFDQEVEVPSVESIWKAADWHEREAFDMMGVKFSGHPDMKRILLPDDWEGHPLKKDYKTPEYYNGMPVPKDKSYWE